VIDRREIDEAARRYGPELRPVLEDLTIRSATEDLVAEIEAHLAAVTSDDDE